MTLTKALRNLAGQPQFRARVLETPARRPETLRSYMEKGMRGAGTEPR